MTTRAFFRGLSLAGLLVVAVTAAENRYALGSVEVIIPPPQGFEEVLSRFEEMRARMPDSDRLENLAAHLPADVVRTLKPGQDLSFYTKVTVSKAAKAVDVSAETFASVAKQMAGTKVFEEDPFQKWLRELEKDRGVVLDQPLQLGLVDQTPTSSTTLVLAAVSRGDRKVHLLATTSVVYLRRRLLMVYAYRVFETAKDRTILEDFTKAWVRAIAAANP